MTRPRWRKRTPGSRPEGKDDLATILAASSLPKMPVKHKHWAILYDTKTSGESSSQPNCRVPQFRKDHFRKCVHACLKARGEDDIEANALVLVLDGWRSLDSMITNSLVTVENGEAMTDRTKTIFQVIYDEKALSARKSITRGLINQTEGLLVYSRGALDIQKQDRIPWQHAGHGPGGGRGTSLRGAMALEQAC